MAVATFAAAYSGGPYPCPAHDSHSAQAAATLVGSPSDTEKRLHWGLDVTMNEVIYLPGTDNALMKSAFQAPAAFNIIKADRSKASNRVNFRWAEKG